MKNIWVVLLITFLLLVTVIWFYKLGLFTPEIEYVPTKIEVEQINYFKEIALKSQYFDNPEKVTKWRNTMYLYIDKGEEFNEQMVVLSNTIKSINSISSDGFKIEITENRKKANAFLYLCTKEELKEVAPEFHKFLNDSVHIDYHGYTYVEFNWSNFVITTSLMFVDTESSVEEQKITIIEELTHSIGLVNDSNQYTDSIFHEMDSISNSDIYKYSKMDIALINFLYHPDMKPGFNDKAAELVIKRILKEENKSRSVKSPDFVQ